jgi:hypothetical protein
MAESKKKKDTLCLLPAVLLANNFLHLPWVDNGRIPFQVHPDQCIRDTFTLKVIPSKDRVVLIRAAGRSYALSAYDLLSCKLHIWLYRDFGGYQLVPDLMSPGDFWTSEIIDHVDKTVCSEYTAEALQMCRHRYLEELEQKAAFAAGCLWTRSAPATSSLKRDDDSFVSYPSQQVVVTLPFSFGLSIALMSVEHLLDDIKQKKDDDGINIAVALRRPDEKDNLCCAVLSQLLSDAVPEFTTVWPQLSALPEDKLRGKVEEAVVLLLKGAESDYNLNLASISVPVRRLLTNCVFMMLSR